MHKLQRPAALAADVSLLFVAFFWGVGFVAMKYSLESYPTFWLLTLRFSISAILMAALFWKRVVALTREDLKAGALIGAFLFLGFAAQTLGLNYTTPGKQAFITAAYVVLVPFLSWGVSRRFPGRLAFITSFLCVIGIGFLTLQEKIADFNVGDGLTLICTFFFAAQVVSIEHYTATRDPILLAILQTAGAALLSLPAALLFETWPGIVTGPALWGLAFSVIFCTVIAFVIQNVAQKFTPSTHAAIILSLESVFGALSGVVFTEEVFTGRMVVGCLFILLAVLLTQGGDVLTGKLPGKRNPSSVEEHPL